MGKWIHRLTELDKIALTAVCEECGPTRVIKRNNSRANGVQYACGTNYRRRLNVRQQVRAVVADRLAMLLCEICGFVAIDECQLDPDHIVRVSDGGALLDPLNIQVICANCHRVKSKMEQLAPDQLHRIGQLSPWRRKQAQAAQNQQSAAWVRAEVRRRVQMALAEPPKA